jgi:hypothetical protein
MMTAELVACCMPEDPVSPVQARRYVMACTAVYERGLGVSAHRFLHSLLQFYGLELHDLTPMGILHMAAFVILCEAYMGIEPHFNLWNYFFHVWLQQGSSTKVAALGSVYILIRSACGVDPYLHLSTSGPPDGWQKV